MPDIGFTHVALGVSDSAASVAFYERFAGLREVHRRPADDYPGDVVWLADGTRPFVLVLVPVEPVSPLKPLNHLGVGCESRAEVDRLVDAARRDGLVTMGPEDAGPPVGYFAIVLDPDGHALELSHGQEVGLTTRPDSDRSEARQS